MSMSDVNDDLGLGLFESEQGPRRPDATSLDVLTECMQGASTRSLCLLCPWLVPTFHTYVSQILI